MSDSEDDPRPRVDREAILTLRRRRFVAAALTGLATTTLATACPRPCLEVSPPPEPGGDGQPRDDGDPLEEASPQEGGAPEEERGAGEADDAAEAQGPAEGDAPEGS